MKRIIRKIIPAIIILFLGASIIGNWFLLNQNFHLNKKIEELNKEAEKYQAIEEDYKAFLPRDSTLLIFILARLMHPSKA